MTREELMKCITFNPNPQYKCWIKCRPIGGGRGCGDLIDYVYCKFDRHLCFNSPRHEWSKFIEQLDDGEEDITYPEFMALRYHAKFSQHRDRYEKTSEEGI